MNAVLESLNLAEFRKNELKIGLGCSVCGWIAEKVAKYRTQGVTKIERYCECLEKLQ